MIWLDQGGQQCDLALIPAPPTLGHCVEHFWVQNPVPQGMRRIVPDLNAHVIFWTTQGPRLHKANCHIVGARSTFFDLNTVGRGLTIGARLRPGVLPELLHDTAAQLTDRTVPLEDIAGRSAAWLLERMVEAEPREAVEHLAEFLTARLASLTAPATGLLERVTSVFELAQTLHRNRRTAYNRSTEVVGLAPKRALRIHRLHKALFELNKGRSLADAAGIAAYSDQAHFSREAVRLLGESPGVWRRRRNCSFVQDTHRSR
jgi:AraC-like DNA-binding protein